MTASNQGCVRMDTLEELSIESLPVSLLAQLLVGPCDHLRWTNNRLLVNLSMGRAQAPAWTVNLTDKPMYRT